MSKMCERAERILCFKFRFIPNNNEGGSTVDCIGLFLDLKVRGSNEVLRQVRHHSRPRWLRGPPDQHSWNPQLHCYMI